MGWLEGFPFKSREQIEKDQKAFEKRVLPFGTAQRDAAKNVLKELLPPRTRDDEMLFAFISAKDAFTQEEDPAQGRVAALASLKRGKWLKEPALSYVLALIMLDVQIGSLEEYPTAEQVRTYAGQEQA